MTINGPAPTILAFFFNTASASRYGGFLGAGAPRGHRGAGAAAGQPSGASWDEVRALLTDEEYRRIEAETVKRVRGTVQADILKEDQGQNTCIFSTEFALRLMGDVQQYFIDRDVRNFYSVSISGLPHRRGGRQPDPPARLHPGQRLHLRRVLPLPGHGDRRLRPQPVVLLLERHGRRVRGDRPGGAADLGGGAARPLRRQRAEPEAQVPHPDLRAEPPRQEIDFNDIRTTLQALLATSTTPRASTPTPTTRRSPRRPRNRCAGRWRSSSSSTASSAWRSARTRPRGASSWRS
jgi:isobutyryl-CoA mutase